MHGCDPGISHRSQIFTNTVCAVLVDQTCVEVDIIVTAVMVGRELRDHRAVLSVCYLYTVSGKKRPRYFQLQLSHSLVDFYNFYTIRNRNEHSTITCNLLT